MILARLFPCLQKNRGQEWEADAVILLYSRQVTALTLSTAGSKAKGEAVNVGNTKEVTVVKLAQEIKDIRKLVPLGG